MEKYSCDDPSKSTDDSSGLKKEIIDLKKEIIKYKIILNEYGISSKEGSDITDEEWICINEIDKLREKSTLRGLDDDEIKSLETLVKTLERIRNESAKAKKTAKGKKTDIGKLLEIASSD